MRILTIILGILIAGTAASAQPVQGILDLVKRRLPDHVAEFTFSIVNATAASPSKYNDEYTVSRSATGKILVEGNSLSALSMGLHRYLADVVHVDMYWYIGSQMHLAPVVLPQPTSPLKGSSIVPWRYHFNTVTFSYTAAFWTWEDWELELDWLAFHGVNLPLAWVGFEKILVEVFQELGMTDAELSTFLSGPAFQAWNRFGNIQGSWGGELPISWIEGQFALQKQIVQRMLELGMTPVLPAFTGFVPRAISRLQPNATAVIGSQWEDFPIEYTNDTFLQPSDPLFSQLQTSFITKQAQAYGNITHIYTLDQFNENDPTSGDLSYLQNVSYYTWKSLKTADPDAIWMMQGWLFFSNEAFWTDQRVEAFLSGVEENSDMLILDLFSETQPQWQRTNSYYGKPWIWCELHNYGGNMGLYGQIENITVNPIEALTHSSSLVGFGLTMEGQEMGNQIVYDLLLDQAWSASPIDTETYFRDWVTTRYSYANPARAPPSLYAAWDLMRTTVYNNTNLTSAQAVTKSILELSPNTTGLLNRTGHHPTTINYDPAVVASAWNMLYDASAADPTLWNNSAYQFDLVDVTRQVIANAFVPLYTDYVSAFTSNTTSNLSATGNQMISLLTALDSILSTNPNFALSTWLASARAWANNVPNATATAAYYEYDARNQITLWGPKGQISDYASKSWGGLVSSYYVPRWTIFVDYLRSSSRASYDATALADQLLEFELAWQTDTWGGDATDAYGTKGDLEDLLKEAKCRKPHILHEKPMNISKYALDYAARFLDYVMTAPFLFDLKQKDGPKIETCFDAIVKGSTNFTKAPIVNISFGLENPQIFV